MEATHLLLTAHEHMLASFVIAGKDDPTVGRWKENDTTDCIKAMMLLYVLIHICY